ncbi:hypothetical protein CAPTEDRAFT_199045 [Capitella teleta]|uniref:Uncharacterized protein n=1 Tax=Capitella teleta TaxID=283909 RepID=R7T835_CAPTE|nr:hypothetical protein CAPTEDRAFT_199045 [Capitella teleta]|eukprot:ELT89760.1 hypothetical protein CAPTEDRAFT_199045 [Capitella teleta]
MFQSVFMLLKTVHNSRNEAKELNKNSHCITEKNQNQVKANLKLDRLKQLRLTRGNQASTEHVGSAYQQKRMDRNTHGNRDSTSGITHHSQEEEAASRVSASEGRPPPHAVERCATHNPVAKNEAHTSGYKKTGQFRTQKNAEGSEHSKGGGKKEKKRSKRVYDMSSHMGLRQIRVNEPTHIKGNILDLIFTDNDDVKVSVLKQADIADHLPVITSRSQMTSRSMRAPKEGSHDLDVPSSRLEKPFQIH